MNLQPHHGLLIVLLATALLAGCGIKPNSLEPPPSNDGKKSDFPRKYPAPEKY